MDAEVVRVEIKAKKKGRTKLKSQQRLLCPTSSEVLLNSMIWGVSPGSLWNWSTSWVQKENLKPLIQTHTDQLQNVPLSSQRRYTSMRTHPRNTVLNLIAPGLLNVLMFSTGRSQNSKDLLIIPTSFFSFLTESNITVSLSSNSSEVLEGDVIQLTCSVQSTTGPLSVVWQWTDKGATGSTQDVASVDLDGVVWHSPTYRERSSYGEIHVERVRADTFALSLYNALPGDEGEYRCTVTEWLQADTEAELNWEKIGEMSATKTVTVKTVGKLFQPKHKSVCIPTS